jgi:type VI secretion system secreted protein VgrG
VKRDRREKIERDEQRLISRDQIVKVDRDVHLKVGGKHAVEITGSKSLKVSGAVAESFASHSEECSGSLYLKGMNVVIEAMTGLTIKVGGSFVTVNAGGVQISGPMVMINSGGAALSGTAGSLVPPTAPAVADDADDAKPGTKIKLEQKSLARKQRTHKEPSSASGNSGDKSNKDEKKSWIEIKLVDEAGNPVAGEAYQITTPDGKIASGSTNEKGEAKVSGMDPGTCKITFPNLDKDAWE